MGSDVDKSEVTGCGLVLHSGELLGEIVRLRTVKAYLVEALEAAIECGMVPTSTAKDGGAPRHSRQVQVADMIRAALAKAEGRGDE